MKWTILLKVTELSTICLLPGGGGGGGGGVLP